MEEIQFPRVVSFCSARGMDRVGQEIESIAKVAVHRSCFPIRLDAKQTLIKASLIFAFLKRRCIVNAVHITSLDIYYHRSVYGDSLAWVRCLDSRGPLLNFYHIFFIMTRTAMRALRSSPLVSAAPLLLPFLPSPPTLNDLHSPSSSAPH